MEAERSKNNISGSSERHFPRPIFNLFSFRELTRAPTTLHSDIVRKADNYGLKEWITNRFTRSAVN